MATSSPKRLVINTRERAVSNDIMRAQAMLGAAVADLSRYTLLAQVNEAQANGLAVMSSTQDTPLTAVILSGLMVKPTVGGTDCQVSPGEVLVIDPTGDSSDESPAKLVVDPGVTAAGSLAFLANAAPGTVRIDVYECSIGDTVIEQSSRDVYNAVTGTFAAAMVTKVAGTRLTYRVRRGVAGAGIPANQAGWLPLAVCTVPSAAVNYDGCEFWDVRPLRADLDGNGNVVDDFPKRRGAWSFGFRVAKATDAKMYLMGEINTRYKQWRAGGVTKPSTSEPPIIIWDATAGAGAAGANSDATMLSATFAAGRLAYVYALFPGGLPRWCRYTPASAGVRQPSGFRGVPVATTEKPSDALGYPRASITLPSALQLGDVSTTSGVLVSAIGGNTGILATQTFAPAFSDESWVQYLSAGIAAGTCTNSTSVVTLVPAANIFPVTARALRGYLVLSYTGTGTSSQMITFTGSVADANGLVTFGFGGTVPVVTAAATATSVKIPFEIILPPQSPWNLGLSTMSLTFAYDSIASANTFSASVAFTGYRQ